MRMLYFEEKNCSSRHSEHGNLVSMVALMIFARRLKNSLPPKLIRLKEKIHTLHQHTIYEHIHSLEHRANQPPIVILLHVPRRSRPHWIFPNENPRHVHKHSVGEKREEFVLTPRWLSLALSSANATQTKARRQKHHNFIRLPHEKAELMRWRWRSCSHYLI